MGDIQVIRRYPDIAQRVFFTFFGGNIDPYSETSQAFIPDSTGQLTQHLVERAVFFRDVKDMLDWRRTQSMCRGQWIFTVIGHYDLPESIINYLLGPGFKHCGIWSVHNLEGAQLNVSDITALWRVEEAFSPIRACAKTAGRRDEKFAPVF